MTRWLPIPALLASIACGGSPAGPTNPWGDPVLGVAGTWRYDATLKEVEGGECVGQTLFEVGVGTTSRGTITIQQDRATLTAMSDFEGVHCTWTGIVDRDSGELRRVRCDLDDAFFFECPGERFRSVALVASVININFASEHEFTGWQTDNYSVYVIGSPFGVGHLTARIALTARK